MASFQDMMNPQALGSMMGMGTSQGPASPIDQSAGAEALGERFASNSDANFPLENPMESHGSNAPPPAEDFIGPAGGFMSSTGLQTNQRNQDQDDMLASLYLDRLKDVDSNSQALQSKTPSALSPALGSPPMGGANTPPMGGSPMMGPPSPMGAPPMRRPMSPPMGLPPARR